MPLMVVVVALRVSARLSKGRYIQLRDMVRIGFLDGEMPAR
jgi:hypothetical protein